MRWSRCYLFALLFAFFSVHCASTANAAEWMFERSYYTHDPVQPVRVGPQPPSGGPYYSRVQGAYTSSGMRQLRSTIRVGNSVDNYYQWDGWVQRGVQY
jgi:hypothetical protein